VTRLARHLGTDPATLRHAFLLAPFGVLALYLVVLGVTL
jgi:hypothetical protein